MAGSGLIQIVLSACRKSLMLGQNKCILLRRGGRNEPFISLFLMLLIGVDTL